MNNRGFAATILVGLLAGVAVAGGPALPAAAAPGPTTAVCALSTDTTYTVDGEVVYRGTDVWRVGGAGTTDLGPLFAFPVGHIYGGGYGLFATHARTGDLYRYASGLWTRIGGPGAEFAVTRDGLYGLTPDRGAVYRWTGSGTAWTRYSGPAQHLYGGGFGLFATGRLTGTLYRVTPSGMVAVGGPGAEFAVTRYSIYGLSPDRSAIYRWAGANWTRVGGPAAHIYAGAGDLLLATSPTTGNVYRHTMTYGWERIGGPGAAFVVTDDGTIYGLNPSRRVIYRHNAATSWTQVSRNSPIAEITACG